MPRQTLNIRNFHTGLISNPDAQDIPLDACTDMDSVALDGQGRLIGLPTAGSAVGSVVNLEFGEFVTDLNSDWHLIYANSATNLCAVVTDFYGTPTTVIPTDYLSIGAVHKPNTIVAKNGVAHIGITNLVAPEWVGKISTGQFGGSAPSGFLRLPAECKAYSGTSSGQFSLIGGTPAGSGAKFVVGYKYNWAYSLVYDGIQESPLITAIIDYDPGAATEGKYKPIVIIADNAVLSPTSFNPRITAVNLYRAESVTGSNRDYGFYKLIESIDINDAGWTTDGNDKIYTFNDYGEPTGASYEDNTGLLETATTTIPYYKISADVNDSLFVGLCYVPDIPDATHMIFKSKEFRYSMFDVYNEYIRLRRIPTAMRGYNGKLLVWDNYEMHLIDPNGFYIIDSLEGAGCSSHKSVKVTPYGVFFANSQSAYKFDGKVHRISDPIKNLWQAETATPKVNYDEKENLVLFHFGAECYYYHVEYNTWGYASSFHSGFAGGFQGKDGESYSSGSTTTVENFGGNSTRAWDWTSKEIDFDTWQDKKFYYLVVDGTATTTYGIDGGTPSTSLVNTNEIGGSGSWKQGKTLTTKLVATGGNSVSRIEIIGRVLSPRTNTRIVIP